MLQVYLVRHAETKWNIERRIQGQSDSPLTDNGKQQAFQVAKRAKTFGVTQVIASDLGRARKTARIIADACRCSITFDARLRELHMGILENRYIDSLTDEEKNWRQSLLNGEKDRRIPNGESVQELSARISAALNDCLKLPEGSRPLLVSHGIALCCLVNTILGLSDHTEQRLRLRNCSISRVNYQKNSWLTPGWVVEVAGDISHLLHQYNEYIVK